MISRITVLLLCSLSSLAMNPAPDAPIFRCLSNNDLEGLERERLLDQRWSSQRNKKNESPLQVAIRLKNSDLVFHILDKGAKVKKNDVIYAMIFFFNIPKKRLAPVDEPLLIESSLNKELILAGLRDVAPEQSLVMVAQVLSLFERPEDAVLTIKQLFKEGQLIDRALQIILSVWFKTCLEDRLLSKEQFIFIVRVLSDVGNPHLLLRFVVERASSNKVPVPTAKYCTASGEAKKIWIAQELAPAIIELSRATFLTLSAGILVQDLKKRGHAAVTNAINIQEMLDQFVKLSLDVSDDEECKRRYQFWLAVYDILNGEGDFMGSYAIGASLSADIIKNKIGNKLFREMLFSQGNFKEYRDKALNPETEFFVPSPIVFMRDLEFMAGQELIIDNELNKEHLEVYIYFQRHMQRATQKILAHVYPAASPYTELVADLPNLVMEMPSEKLIEAFKLLWPATTSRRRSLTNFF